MENFIKRIFVPDEQRKRTTLASNLYYDVLDQGIITPEQFEAKKNELLGL